MANVRYQTILGLVVAPPGRRHKPAFVDSCPVLHIARATSPNCTHQNQNTQMTWRNGIAKNAVNLSQSRKGPRPTCRMSSKELPVWRNNTRDWSRWSDSSWASQSHSPARGISAVGKIFPFLFHAVVLSCPYILQVHSAETHPRALHSEHIKAYASSCAHVSQQCQPMSPITSELQQGYCTAPQHGSGLPGTKMRLKNMTEWGTSTEKQRIKAGFIV